MSSSLRYFWRLSFGLEPDPRSRSLRSDRHKRRSTSGPHSYYFRDILALDGAPFAERGGNPAVENLRLDPMSTAGRIIDRYGCERRHDSRADRCGLATSAPSA